MFTSLYSEVDVEPTQSALNSKKDMKLYLYEDGSLYWIGWCGIFGHPGDSF